MVVSNLCLLLSKRGYFLEGSKNNLCDLSNLVTTEVGKQQLITYSALWFPLICLLGTRPCLFVSGVGCTVARAAVEPKWAVLVLGPLAECLPVLSLDS